MNYYDIAVNFPKIHSILTYKSDDTFQIGDLVEVPLGGGQRKAKGCVVEQKKQEEFREEDSEFPIKEVSAPISSFQIGGELLHLLTWISQYYHYSLGKLIFDVLPRPLERPRQLNFFNGRGEALGFELNGMQKEIVAKIAGHIGAGYSPHLIHGVTGSGKTIIYLELIKQVMARGESVLFLLPEINLTQQFLSFFQQHTSGLVYSYNSSLSNSDKFGLWKLLEHDHRWQVHFGGQKCHFLTHKKLRSYHCR